MHQIIFPCGFVTLFGVTSMGRKFNLGLNLTPPPFPCTTHSLKKNDRVSCPNTREL